VFWIAFAVGSRLDGWSLEWVLGHVVLCSEGGTANPPLKGTPPAWHRMCASPPVMAGWHAIRSQRLGQNGEERVLRLFPVPWVLNTESSPVSTEAAGFSSIWSSNEFGSNNPNEI